MNLDVLIPGLMPLLIGESEGLRCESLAILLAKGRSCSLNVPQHRAADPKAAAVNHSAASTLASYLACQFVDLPLAQWAAQADGFDTRGLSPGQLWCADPVHLFPDRDRLLLFDAHSLELDDEEAQGLLAQLNSQGEEWGWHWFAAHADRWYLRCESPLDIRTHALEEVVARPVDDYLPQGEDASLLAARLTELQMGLYTNPHNQQRDMSGQHTVNSVWLWGGEASSHAAERFVPDIVPDRVYCGDAPVLGWARQAGIDTSPVPPGAASLFGGAGKAARSDRIMLVLESMQTAASYGDVMMWQTAFESLCADWLKPILDALRAGQIRHLRMFGGDGCVVNVTGRDLYRFWRRVGPLQASKI